MSDDTQTAQEAPKKTTLTVMLDGRPIEAEPGELLIAAAERHGTYIPRFCWHPRMREVGMCRMCLVEVVGPRGPALQPACMQPVAEGMVVDTKSATVKKAQDGVLEFLLINHPLDCPVCDKGGECPLQDQTLTFGPGETRFVEEKRHFEKPIAISDLVYLDRERCILCDRCTRFSKEVSGDPLIHFVNRGNHTEVNTFPDHPYASYFSGNVVQICPVGALTAQPYRFTARPWDLDQVESTCTTCAVGCRVVAQSSGDRITRYQGVDADPVNWGWLCDKGRFDFESIASPSRLSAPYARSGKGAELRETTWGDALAKAATAIKARGADEIGVIGGARLTNEDQYAWAKLAKSVIGTDNVDAQLGDGLPAEAVIGLPAATIDEVCASSAIVVLGADVKEDAPVLFLRLRDAAVNRRALIIEVVPKATGLTSYADHSLRHRAGEAGIVVRALLDAAEGRKQAEHNVGGVEADALNGAAAALRAAREAAGASGAKVGVVFGRANLAERADATIEALSLLHAHVGEARFLPCLRRGNVRGALELGLAPGLLPGRIARGKGDGAFTDHGWTFPAKPGLDTLAMLEAAAAGTLKVLVLLGADVLNDVPDRDLAERALQQVETLIAVDTIPNESTGRADIVLPAAGYAEKNGTTTNLEGRVSALAAKVTPPGLARPDWMIAVELAVHLDAELGFDSLDGAFDEMTQVAPSLRGLTRQHLSSHPDGVVTPLAGGDGAVSQSNDEAGSIAAPALVRFTPSTGPAAVPVPDAYSLRLVTTHGLYDNGTTVSASPSLAKLVPEARLRLHPGELERHGLRRGLRARVVNQLSASAVFEVEPDATVPRGSAYLVFNQGAIAASSLIERGEAVTKVRLETIDDNAGGGA